MSDKVKPASTEPYSLRDWLCDLDDNSGMPLIHAAYKSTHEGKIFILCEQSKVTQILHPLHNIVQYTSAIFPYYVIDIYFGPEKSGCNYTETPTIKYYPRHLCIIFVNSYHDSKPTGRSSTR